MINSNNPTPLISVLIPTYMYLEGLQRILQAIGSRSQYQNNIEIIVSDDSIDYTISEYINSIKCTHDIIYERNQPPLGAVKNWNKLISMAKGEYIVLMHHDEYPISPKYFHRLAKELNYYNYPPVMISQCILESVTGSVYKRNVNMTNVIRKIIVNISPTYLLKRNIIGPTSVVVAKREIYPQFDINLKWLVDVDLYYRLHLQERNWIFSKSLQIVSRLNNPYSITKSLKGKLKKLHVTESKYISNKYNLNKYYYLFKLDLPFWIFIKIIDLLFKLDAHKIKFSTKLLNRKD